MAITKLGHMKECTGRNPAAHLKNAIKYILNPEKTGNGAFVGGNCDWLEPFKTFMETKERYGKMDGRQGYHIILSFPPGEVTEGQALNLTSEWVEQYLGDDYDAVFAVHNDQEHMHAHIIFNSVSRTTGYKYHYKKGDWERYIQPITDSLCGKYGLSKLEYEDMDGKNQPYNLWRDEKEGKITRYDIIRKDIDTAIRQSASYEGVLNYLREQLGYEIRSGNSKAHQRYISLHNPNYDNPVRSYRLGEEYTIEAIIRRIQDQKEGKESPVVQLNDEKWLKRPPRIRQTRIQIPYEKYRNGKNLSKYQKQHLRKMYNARRMYSPMYQYVPKYRHDVLIVGRLQSQIIYMYRHNLTTETAVQERKAYMGQTDIRLNQLRQQVYSKYRNFKSGFKVLKEYKQMKAKYSQVMSLGQKAAIKERLKEIETTYDIPGLDINYEDYQESLQKIRKAKQEIKKEIRTLDNILKQDIKTAERVKNAKEIKKRGEVDKGSERNRMPI